MLALPQARIVENLGIESYSARLRRKATSASESMLLETVRTFALSTRFNTTLSPRSDCKVARTVKLPDFAFQFRGLVAADWFLGTGSILGVL